MRYNIQKLQRGGGIATFTPIIEQASPQDAALVSSFGETPKKSSILDDASFKQLLKGEGLTNDIIAFTNELSKLESSSTNPFVSGSNRGYGLKAIAKIYELKNNKEAWQDAIKTSRENGGYSEVAVGNQGELYTKDSSGKIGTIDATEYAKNRNKVKVLSVAELLNERQNNSQLTGQNQVFDVANNSVGMGKITDHIKGLISAFGTESQDETKTYSKDQLAEQYKQLSGKKPTAEDMTSMKTLANILSTPGDYYKVTQENSSERNHVDKALDYIWKTLDKSAQKKLIATAAINGVSDPRNFIKDMIITQTNVKTSMDISPTELPHAKNPDGSPKSVSLTPTELFHLGKLNIAGNDYEINNDKGAKMKVHASSVGSLLDLHTNKPVGTGTLNSVLIDSGLNMLLDTNKAFLGDKKIDPNQLQNLVHNGQKDVAQVFLPVKGDGTPDFDSMKEFRDIMTVYDTNKNKESIKVSEKRFADHGFKIKIDQVQGADGKITKVIRDNAQVKPFLAIPTLTNSATDFADNPYLVKLKGAEGDAATQLMESAWTVNGGTKSKPTSKNLTPSGYFSLEKPLAGMTYIAYRPEAPAVITSMNKHLSGPAPTMVDVQRNLNFSSNQPGSTSTNAGARVLIQ